MGLRELLILILILAIVGVILRGLYVALRARRGQLRMQLDKNIPQYDPEELVLSELPNGGARMVERSFAHVLQQNSEFSSKERRKAGKSDQAIPVLMDSIGDEDEEEGVGTARQSNVASARDAARKKHLLGSRNAPITQKPVHRPIDRMAAAAQNPPTATNMPVTMQDTRESEYDNDDYDDPLDNHIFSDPEFEGEADQESTFQQAEKIHDDDDDDDEFDDDYDEVDDFDDSPSEQSVDADDDYEDDDEDEDFDDELDDELDESDDAEEAQEQDSDFDEQDDDLYEKQAYDDDDSWEEEYDAENEEVDLELVAEEFDTVYGESEEDADHHSAEHEEELFDDADDGWDDDTEVEEQEPVESAPRRWLKWAGSKLSGMGASSEEPVREREFHGHDRAEPVIGLDGFDEDLSPAPAPAPAPTPAPQPRSNKVSLDRSHQTQMSFDDEDDNYQDDEETEEFYEDEPEPEPVRAPAPKSEASAADTSVPQEYSEVLVINVAAKPDREFYGVDLLQALLATGLRFGDMSIFHRHFDQDPSSPVLFSVANMVNPGTFDLNQINDFATRGVCFFMTLPNVANSMQAFDRMLDAAQQLRIALDGDLKDDNRSVMTAQTIEHYRQRVRDFDLRQLRQQK